MSETCCEDSLSAFERLTLLCQKDRLDIDDMKRMVLIEQWAQTFYDALAGVCPNEEGKALLQKNGVEELGHAHRLVRGIRQLGGDFSIPDLEKNPYVSAAEPPPASTDFLTGLESAERDADTAYQKWADNEPVKSVADLLRLNGKEETGHAVRVAAVIRSITGTSA